MRATMEIDLESVDGRVDEVIVAKTSNNICGGIKPTNWLQIKDQLRYLRQVSVDCSLCRDSFVNGYSIVVKYLDSS